MGVPNNNLKGGNGDEDENEDDGLDGGAAPTRHGSSNFSCKKQASRHKDGVLLYIQSYARAKGLCVAVKICRKVGRKGVRTG